MKHVFQTEQCCGFLRISFYFEQVLAESEQMRREADDTGPMAELEHWKMRMAKFNSLVEQIKGADCKAVIRILLMAKSKTLKVILAAGIKYAWCSATQCQHILCLSHAQVFIM